MRRLTRTMRSMGANTSTTPGPFGWGRSLPSRKMTPRSYSRRILIELKHVEQDDQQEDGAGAIIMKRLLPPIASAGTTRSVRPSTATTRRSRPAAIGAVGRRVPDLAVDGDLRRAAGRRRRVSARAAAPIMPARRSRPAAAAHGGPAGPSKSEDRATWPSHRQTISRRPKRDAGHVARAASASRRPG